MSEAAISGEDGLDVVGADLVDQLVERRHDLVELRKVGRFIKVAAVPNPPTQRCGRGHLEAVRSGPPADDADVGMAAEAIFQALGPLSRPGPYGAEGR